LFRTYAVHWLNQAYRSFLYNNGQTVRVPVYLQKAMKHVRAAQDKLGPDASVAEIAKEADLGEHLVQSALTASRSTLSIDSPFSAGDDGSGGLAEVLSQVDDSSVYSSTMEDMTLEDGIHGAMDRLSERERLVIEMRFGINCEREHTLSEVAKELGVSLERVRQIQVRAISKMRTPGLRKAIDPFL
ncbi:MAG: sigma-70 family RNA polymerase sigma factor, partial [Planctomycetota bacterium]